MMIHNRQEYMPGL